jgi:hypothetical protein
MTLFAAPLSWNKQVGKSVTGIPAAVGATLQVSVTLPLNVVEFAVMDVFADCPGEVTVRVVPAVGSGVKLKLDELTVTVAEVVLIDVEQLPPVGVNVAVTVVDAAGVTLARVASPPTKPPLSNVPALDMKLVAGVTFPQPVTTGVQVKVTVPARKAPKLPPEEAAALLNVSTKAESVTFVPAATVMLVAGEIAAVPAETDVVVGAAITVKATGVGAVLVPLTQGPPPGLGQ